MLFCIWLHGFISDEKEAFIKRKRSGPINFFSSSGGLERAIRDTLPLPNWCNSILPTLSALGTGWSRYWAYTADELFKSSLNAFEDEQSTSWWLAC